MAKRQAVKGRTLEQREAALQDRLKKLQVQKQIRDLRDSLKKK